MQHPHYAGKGMGCFLWPSLISRTLVSYLSLVSYDLDSIEMKKVSLNRKHVGLGT
jgi:hypothetical protein